MVIREDLNPGADARPGESAAFPETPARPDRVPSVPHLVHKEAFAALIALTAVCLISALSDAPLAGPADPAGIPASHVKAPWIFVGIQQLLRFLPPLSAGIVVPMTALVLLGLLPFVSPRRRMLTFATFFGITITSVMLTVWSSLG
ncbi:MAG: hypothetical protein HY914_17905 [Desulfomonile tiedjei]|nr:hypothetical protein [Desulfomonile tiedjei]